MTIQTISDDYRAEQRRLHENPRYGVASIGYASLVESLLKLGKCATLSDYGAGKCNLRSALGPSFDAIEYLPYDPAFPEYGPPRPADLLVCIDVLEHVEPERLDQCLDELASITRRLALFTVHTGPARKTLSDGRNAHLTQEPADWWLHKLTARFDVLCLRNVRKGFFAIVCPKGLRASIGTIVDLPAILTAAARCDPRPNLLRGARAAAHRDLGAMWLAARDPRTPRFVKLLAGTVSALALSPIDLTPDVIPVVGYFDDLLLLIAGTIMAVRLMPDPLVAELRARAGAISSRATAGGAAAFISIWLAALLALAVRSSYPAF